MNKHTRMYQKGFTLVEVMIVVTIIVLLASVVLFSVDTARNIARDTSIKASMDSLRPEAAIYFNRFSTYAGFCDASSYLRLEEAIVNSSIGGTSFEARCGHFHYVIYADLNAGPAYCIDSQGYAGEVPEGSERDGQHCTRP